MTPIPTSKSIGLRIPSINLTLNNQARAVFLFADDYHKDVSNGNTMAPLMSMFKSPILVSWERQGFVNIHNDNVCLNAEKHFFTGIGMGTGIRTFVSTIRFNIWLFNRLKSLKPDHIFVCQRATHLASWIYTALVGRNTIIHTPETMAKELMPDFN